MLFRKTMLFLFLVFSVCPLFAQQKIEPKSIDIVRDSFGMPHIFAASNAEVVYGLAWANAEDNFEAMQETVLIAKGLMGRYKGKEGAAFDYFVKALDLEGRYEAQKDQLNDEFMQLLSAYVTALNNFAKKQPKRVLFKRAFPVTEKDILKVYLLSFAALSGLPDALGDIMEGREPGAFSQKAPLGSNAYAMSKSRTASGQTYLAINPHFMLQGPLSFYEAHLYSEEGWNITGALFQGGTSVFMGNNEHLGWGHTFNYLDLLDVFELDMHPKKKKQYRWGEGYKKLQTRRFWLKVKVGAFVLPVRRKTYWSEFGPTFKAPNGKFYALRSPALDALAAGQQFYEMGKAKNLQEFKAALDQNALPLFNIVYADKEDNLLYLCNGMIPQRPDSFDYSGTLLGKKENCWSNYLSLEEKPLLENPDCGYLFNTNNTPTIASCDSVREEMKVPYTDLRPGLNNRAHRFLELIESEMGLLNWEDFKAIKFDQQLSKASPFYQSIQFIYDLKPEDYPHLRKPLRELQNWSLSADAKDPRAGLVLLTFQYIFKEKGYGDEVFISGPKINTAELLAGLEKASRYLYKHHNKLLVPISELARYQRGEQWQPTSGFPDMLSPTYYEMPNEDGQLVPTFGDTYIHFVRFNENGPAQIQTLLPYFQSPQIQAYKNQVEALEKRSLKTVEMDKIKVMKSALKIYHPE